MKLGTFLSGLVLGGAVALLLAPEKGEKTREKIQDKAKDLQKGLEQQAEKGKGKFKEYSEVGTKKFNDLKTQTQEMVENATKKVNSTVDNA